MDDENASNNDIVARAFENFFVEGSRYTTSPTDGMSASENSASNLTDDISPALSTSSTMPLRYAVLLTRSSIGLLR